MEIQRFGLNFEIYYFFGMVGIFNSKQTDRGLFFASRKIIRTIGHCEKIIIFGVPTNSSHIILLIRTINESPERMKQFRTLLISLLEQVLVLLVLLSLIILDYHSFHDFETLIERFFLLFLVQIQFFDSIIFVNFTMFHIFLVNIVLIYSTAKIESLGLSSPNTNFSDHFLPRLYTNLRIIEFISQNTKSRSDTFFLLLFVFSELFSNIVIFKNLIDFFVSFLLQFFLNFIFIRIFNDLISIIFKMYSHLRNHFINNDLSSHFIIV